MKRIFCFVLCLLMLLPIAACKKIEPIAPDDLESTRALGFSEYKHFSVEDSNTALRLMMPLEWDLEAQDGTYVIKNEDVTVGWLTREAKSDDGMTEVKCESCNDVTVTTYTGVLKHEGEKVAQYRICYEYRDDAGKDRILSLQVLESEMDAMAYDWLTSPELKAIKSYNDPPELSLQNGNGKKSIAVLGNSFVYNHFSGVGVILHDMVTTSGKTCSITAKGIGYATVSQYASGAGEFAAYLNNIKNGTYGIVFMCGLYGSGDVTALQTIYNACQSSSTQLVLFPAHNESSDLIEKALAQYPDIKCVNWKYEIEGLIKSGVKEDDFCFNDEHKHSKPLAGYIGAKMIYQSLFGTEPLALSDSCAVISQSAVDAKLNGHSAAPKVLITEKQLHVLK